MRTDTSKFLFAYLVISFIYTAWMTGFTFTFSECAIFPNYDMLAKGFAQGHLFIDETPPDDAVLFDGKTYVYSGPVPALFRLPVLMLFNRGVPSGLMIALFCAGVSTLFIGILRELTSSDEDPSNSTVGILFTVVFIFNGLSLLMVSIPSFHHEAIGAAMLFMTASVYLVIRAANRGYRMTGGSAVLLGLSLSGAIGSRFSYVFASAFLGLVLTVGMFRHSGAIPKGKIFRILALPAGISLVTIGLLLAYNYARFGACGEFGLTYLRSMYQDYIVHVGFFRYDHLPHNLWAMFFKLPRFIPEFPFLQMPAYVLKIQSVALMRYGMIIVNELCVSVFILMPVLVLFIVPIVAYRAGSRQINIRNYSILATVFALQVLTVALTLGSCARYCYDFVPIMMMMSYMGAVWLKTHGSRPMLILAVLGVLSLVVSFALPVGAIGLYANFINCKSPLFPVFFGPGG